MIKTSLDTALCDYLRPRDIFESGAIRATFKNISILFKASIGCKGFIISSLAKQIKNYYKI
jgi:hypothetical protein